MYLPWDYTPESDNLSKSLVLIGEYNHWTLTLDRDTSSRWRLTLQSLPLLAREHDMPVRIRTPHTHGRAPARAAD